MLRIVPCTIREAKVFVGEHHRHSRVPTGGIFAVAVAQGDIVRGVAITGRPVARRLQDGWTVEITRCCTDGAHNACSMLYGACRRAALALGYRRIVTYTQATETGASLRAAGFRRVKDLPARGSWAESSVKLKGIRDAEGSGGVPRVLWEVTCG
jgi:hypothetical protein